MSEIKVNSIKGVGASSAAITVNNTDGTCTANITNNLSNRNKVINGAVLINQRGNATGVNSQGYYGPDRFKWIQNNSSAAFSINQSTESPDGFANSYHVDCTTADTSVAADSYVRFLYSLEGKDVQDFAKGTSSAKKAVVSFYVKTNKTGTYSVLYFDSDNNRQFTATYTVSNTNWNRYTIPVPEDTTGAFNNDTGPSLEIYFGLVAGSNLTGSVDGVWQPYTQSKEMAGHTVNFADSTSNNFYITGIQLEVDHTGSGVATDFEHRSFGQELALCQRYYYEHANGNNAQNNNRAAICSGGMYNSSNFFGVIQFPVKMRARPSLVKTTGTDYYRVYGANVSDGCNDVSSQNWSDQAFAVNLYDSLSLTQGSGGWAETNNASALIAFNSEL